MGNSREETNWVDFRYEKLRGFYLSRGILIGHSEYYCELKTTCRKNPEVINPSGPRLLGYI